MKYLFGFLSLSLLVFGCSLLEDDNDTVEKNAPVELVITEDSDYPVMGLEEDGTSYLFNEDLSNVYVRTATGDEWSLHIDTSTGKPTHLYMLTASGNYYIVFSGYNGDFVDLAISKVTDITRNSTSKISAVTLETKYVLGVEFEGISSAQPISYLKSAGATAGLWDEFFVPNIKRTVGHVTAAVGCGLGLAGAGVTFAGSAGTATPFSVVMATYACGSFASGLVGDITGVKPFSDLAQGLAINGTTVDCTKAIATRSAADVAGCVNGMIGLATSIGNEGEEIKNVKGNAISADLINFKKSGGLVGSWISKDKPQTVTQSQGGVSMTVTSNPPSLQFTSTICNLVLSGSYSMNGQNMSYEYAYKYQYTLTEDVEYDKDEKGYFCWVNFQIQGVSMTANGTTTFIPWNEYKNSYSSSGVPLPAELSDIEAFDSMYGIFPADNSLVIDLFNGDDAVFYKE
ncbi:hypothetical protein [uncultured Draconibacterium sp.]|uniref:hypothetical protein n=1 Tax=uncultured Draconibacterium sp. TaxID=1573823 RepID=UPI0032177544